MLEYINSDEMISIDEVENEYSGCKYLLVDVNNDFSNFKGKLYCVSRSHDSFEELCNEDRRLTNSGRTTALLGIYDNYSACVAQHMLEM